ncbi:MAG: endolytic transglycosylase MltG [Prolixibacteraceae bacterium]
MAKLNRKTNTILQMGVSLKLALRKCYAFALKVGARIKPPLLRSFSFFLKTRRWKRIITFILFVLILTAFWINHLYTIYYGPNVVKDHLLYIHEKDTFEQVVKILKENDCLTNVASFERFAEIKDYDTNIRPGAYRIKPGWSNNELINILRSGAQSPVMVKFNSVRTLEDLAGKLARQLMCDSSSFLTLFKNDSSTIRMGFVPATLPALFIPNTYSIYWTISPSGFLTRMKREHELFWNDARKLKAKNIGLSTNQVATLASIVQEESNKNDDRAMIAGVYLNRLKKNWPLQADPTIRFALGDFTIRRILTAQLEVDSPYNTYKNAGLPPGPVNIPEISALDAVLNYKVHDYYYFCAKEDFSGYTNFAKTLSEHNRNAKRYHEALSRMKVFK